MNRRAICLLLTAATLLLGHWAPVGAQSERITPIRRPGPPITPAPTSDEDLASGVVLESVNIDIRMTAVAMTTLVDVSLFNPQSMPHEATLVFSLAPGQQVSNFALDFNGQLRSAVAVEKARGRQVFEDVERRRVDPALLEKTEGENFRLRVFPVPVQGRRRAVMEIIQTNAQADRYITFPSPELRNARSWRVAIHVTGEQAPRIHLAGELLHFTEETGGYVAYIEKGQWAPTDRLEIDAVPSAQVQVALDGGEQASYLLAELPIDIPKGPRRIGPIVGLLWDSSASHDPRAVQLELDALDAYFKAAGQVEVRLQRLRNHAEKIERFRVSDGNWETLRTALRNSVYDGATALSDFVVESDVNEYLLVSDGLSNYDRHPFPELKARQRLFALTASAHANRARLAALCNRYAGRLVSIDPSADAAGAATALISEVPRIAASGEDGVTDIVFDRTALAQGHLQVSAQVLRSSGRFTVIVGSDASRKEIPIVFGPQTPRQRGLARVWAQTQVAELAATDDQRARIRRLGEQFNIATDETSLLVLETAADYVRYNVKPPADLRNEVERLQGAMQAHQQSAQSAHLDAIINEFRAKQDWYQGQFFPSPPKSQSRDNTPIPLSFKSARGAFEDTPRLPPARDDKPVPSSPAPGALSTRASGEAADGERVTVTGSNVRRADTENSSPAQMLAQGRTREPGTNGQSVIAIQPYLPDTAYGQRLRSATRETLYAVYLDERPDHRLSPAFYLDASDLLFAKGERELGLRVLSNLAELDLDNRHVLRVLGYRLMQAGDAEMAVAVFLRVRDMAPDEPQSFRDLGLAYAALHRDQEAVDAFAEVMLKPWDPRFSEVELITLADLNDVVARAKDHLDVSRVDHRLLVNMPLELRAVLTWDASDSDLDLWVTDPSGELCRYDHRFTAQGGRLSRDATGGYGPEEFSLRHARPGHYRIEVNYYGANRQLVTGVITATVRLTTNFGTAREKDEAITVRLRAANDRVLIGEFDVKP